MKKIKQLFKKYRELILYVIFGALTTGVNFVSYWVLEHLFGNGGKIYLFTNAAAWLISVIFAYVTNKLFVFESKEITGKSLFKEASEFLGARIFSFLVEEGGMWLLVDISGMKKLLFTVLGIDITGQLISKVILAVIVVILNYVFSKFIVFRKKKTDKND